MPYAKYKTSSFLQFMLSIHQERLSRCFYLIYTIFTFKKVISKSKISMEIHSNKVVKITVHRDKSLVAHPVTQISSCDISWFIFLNQSCGLKVRREDGIQVRTVKYNAEANIGWMTSDLDSQIGDFIGKFKENKDIYGVRLCIGETGRPIGCLQNADTAKSLHHRPPMVVPTTSSDKKLITTSSVGTQVRQNELAAQFLVPVPPNEFQGTANKRPKLGLNTIALMSPSNAVDSGQRSPAITSGSSSSATGSTVVHNDFKRPAQQSKGDLNNLNGISVGQKSTYGGLLDEALRKREELRKYSGSDQRPVVAPLSEDDSMVGRNVSDCPMDSDSDIDSMSQCTATDVGVRELRKDGIHIEEIAPQVKKNVEKIPNDFLLKVKKEILKLQKKTSWSRNFQRAPLSSLFVQEIFL